MFKNESQRQKKFNKLIQQELASLLQDYIKEGSVSNLMISVTKALVSPDLSLAKIYLSIFPSEKALIVLDNISNNSSKIKHDLSQKLKNQIRKIPKLIFLLDDSLDYIEGIEKSLTLSKDPIYNKNILKNKKT
jgi:ribosome-binding factor A